MTSRLLWISLLFAGACAAPEGVGSTEQAVCNCDQEEPPCCCTSPILVDLAGDGFLLTSRADGVRFAPSAGYRPGQRAWTAPGSDDAWLVSDQNGDGVINDGSEMFGDSTPQPRPPPGHKRNGFLALAQHDDGDGRIDARDSIFAMLRLWQDRNHDGVSQPAELHRLPEMGVLGISVVYSEARVADEHGNSFRYRAAVYGAPGSTVGMTAWDVWLTGTVPEPLAGDDEADGRAPGDRRGGPDWPADLADLSGETNVECPPPLPAPDPGTCSCQHRDDFTSGGRSCQELRETGVCMGPYKGSGANRAACQRDAREKAKEECRGCLGHCNYRAP